jgi:hypothetical protein
LVERQPTKGNPSNDVTPRLSRGDNQSLGLILAFCIGGDKRPARGALGERRATAGVSTEGAGVRPEGHPAEFERWFTLLADKQIKRDVHRSVHELKEAIVAFIQAYNPDPKQFV